MMKKLYGIISLFALVVITNACSGGDDSDPVNETCSKIISLDVEQNSSVLDINILSEGALYYEVSLVGINNFSDKPEDGLIFSLANANDEINLQGWGSDGNYLVYARPVCTDSVKGKWFGPKPITITKFCSTPHNLEVVDGTAIWEYDVIGEQVSNFQLQYGVQGFTLGSGTMVTINGNDFSSYSFASMTAGQYYDFYVRAYCSNNVGYGNWEGPYTYYAERTQNMCLEPSNIQPHYTNVNSQTRFVYFSWDSNGEMQFEYALVYRGEDINGATLTNGNSTNSTNFTVSVWSDYDFYVRGVCANGNKTAWVKKEINP